MSDTSDDELRQKLAERLYGAEVAFLQELTLPLVQRNLIGAGGNPIPKRLDVVDLVFDRELVPAPM